MLEARELTKCYQKGLPALERLNLKVRAGEIYCLLGANGAGKTTTINLFLNFIEPTSGQAFIAGIDIVREPLEAKKHVAFLPENVRLYGSFTARQNLDFFARIGGVKGLSRKDQDELMAGAGLPDRSFDQKTRNFSKGMRQKLAIAVCVAKNAPALILDEPMAGLDPLSARDLVGILLGLRDQGKAILMSTHDIFRAKELADRVGLLKGGVKIFERSRAELEPVELEKVYLEYMRETMLPRRDGE